MIDGGLNAYHLQYLLWGALWTIGLSLISFIGGGLAGGVIAPSLLAPQATTHSAVRTLMGTRIHLTVVADDARQAETAITATFDAMARLVALFDHRQPASALATLGGDRRSLRRGQPG